MCPWVIELEAFQGTHAARQAVTSTPVGIPLANMLLTRWCGLAWLPGRVPVFVENVRKGSFRSVFQRRDWRVAQFQSEQRRVEMWIPDLTGQGRRGTHGCRPPGRGPGASSSNCCAHSVHS